ncbi:MAG: hypothetical protein IPK02_03730 [Candidatus Accumulibacter sp.]|uniref:Calcium-binding protein n=1 Tax=Candidatus Accumulibacter affinis TaxID=2954384 RepID=A0A935T551_9PROT|nr:hypothetical protein [Candidatus Accumulibacter affinis]
MGGGYGNDGINPGADAGRSALELFYDYDRIIVRGVHLLDYTPGGIDVSANAASDRGTGDEIHGESGDDSIHGQKGHDVLFGEGQDDDLIGGYGNDWISGGTGNDGVIGDDGRIMTSRNATTYGEALFGVVRLLADNGDTKTFNGNMMNEAIATPGTIQQAVANVGDEMKKAVNLTPFSFDTTFNGNADEFTSVTKKTVDDRGAPGAPNANDLIFGGLGDDWLHGGSGDDAISGGEALSQAWTQVQLGSGATATIVVARSDYARPFNPGDALRYNPDDPDGWHFDRTRRAGEFALYDEYDPRRKIELVVATNGSTAYKAGDAVKDVRSLITIGEWFLNFSAGEGSWVPSGTLNTNGQQATSYLAASNDGADRIFGGTGNDWLVGGTGRDNLYGGFGNDLLNADDLPGDEQQRDQQQGPRRLAVRQRGTRYAADLRGPRLRRCRPRRADRQHRRRPPDRLGRRVQQLPGAVCAFRYGHGEPDTAAAAGRVPLHAQRERRRRPDSPQGHARRPGAGLPQRRAEGEPRCRAAEGRRLAEPDRRPGRPAGRQHPRWQARRAAHGELQRRPDAGARVRQRHLGGERQRAAGGLHFQQGGCGRGATRWAMPSRSTSRLWPASRWSSQRRAGTPTAM